MTLALTEVIEIWYRAGIDVEDLFLLAFIRLKIGTLELDLAFRFKISQSPVSQIFLR